MTRSQMIAGLTVVLSAIGLAPLATAQSGTRSYPSRVTPMSRYLKCLSCLLIVVSLVGCSGVSQALKPLKSQLKELVQQNRDRTQMRKRNPLLAPAADK